MRCGCANISFALKRVGICNLGGGLTQYKSSAPFTGTELFLPKNSVT